MSVIIRKVVDEIERRILSINTMSDGGNKGFHCFSCGLWDRIHSEGCDIMFLNRVLAALKPPNGGPALELGRLRKAVNDYKLAITGDGSIQHHVSIISTAAQNFIFTLEQLEAATNTESSVVTGNGMPNK